MADGEEYPWKGVDGHPMIEYEAGDLLMVDFDGTLTQGEARYWMDEVEEPVEEMLEWTRQQYFAGAHVVVWTARPWSQAAVIAARLTEWGVPYHGIRCEKGGGSGYVDDKAARPHEVLERPAAELAIEDGDPDGE